MKYVDNASLSGILWFVFVYVMLGVLPSAVISQPLDSVWTQYLEAESSLDTYKTRMKYYRQRQQELLQTIQRKEAAQAWYNGWIIEMQLANLSNELSETADSLEKIRGLMTREESEREKALGSLKSTYRQTIQNRETRHLDTMHTRALIEALRSERRERIPLPDYSTIVEEVGTDGEIRVMVLRDLKAILQNKLTKIDSVLTRRREDRELADRLIAFHEDLEIQREAQSDIGSGTEDYGSTAPNGGSAPGYRDESELSQSKDRIGDRVHDLNGQEVETTPVDIRPLDSELERLRVARQRYRALLDTLSQELDHPE